MDVLGVSDITTMAEMTSEDKQKDDHYEEILQYKIMVYSSPVILVVGVIGNILSLVVFSRRGMSETVTAFLFRMLAIFDLFSLLHISEYFFFLLDVETLSITTWSCRISSFAIRFFKTSSSWVLVLISMDRFIGIHIPHKSKVLLTHTRFRIALAVVLTLIIAVYSPILMLYVSKEEYQPAINKTRSDCSRSKDFVPMYKGILPWLEQLVNCIIPFLLIFFLNSAIAWRLIKVNTTRKICRHAGDPRGANLKSLVVMLLLVSITFLLLNLPYNMYFLIKHTLNLSKKDTGHSLYIKLRPYKAVATVMQALNHSINCFLYCLSGPRFRRELFSILCRRGHSPIHSSYIKASSFSMQHIRCASTKLTNCC